MIPYVIMFVLMLAGVGMAEQRVSADAGTTPAVVVEHPADAGRVAVIDAVAPAPEAQPQADEEADARSKIIDIVFGGVVRNEKVDYFLNYFKTKLNTSFKTMLARSGQYLPVINKIFEENGLAEELVFLPLIESGFSPYATSRAQAVGIWQFVKGTAKRYGLRVDNFVDERKDPIKSTEAAAKYLKYLYNMFGSWDLALAAYNAGEGKISRVMRSSRSDNFWDVIANRKVKRETKEYVPRFVAAAVLAADPQKYGISDVTYEQPLDFVEIMLPGRTTLKSVSKVAGVEESMIERLNPAIKHGVLPPDGEYPVRVPATSRERIEQQTGALERADDKTVRKIATRKEPRKAKKPKKAAGAKRIPDDRRG